MVGTQVWVGQSEPAPDRFNPPTNTDDHLLCKPEGGMWTSTYTPDAEYICDWLRWCDAEKFYSTSSDVWLLEPEDGIEVFTINGQADLEELLDHYTRTDLWGNRPRTPTQGSAVIREARIFSALDFEELAETYDAIRLTEDGQRHTRFSRPSLYGWDAESVLWLHWRIESTEHYGPITTEVAAN